MRVLAPIRNLLRVNIIWERACKFTFDGVRVRVRSRLAAAAADGRTNTHGVMKACFPLTSLCTSPYNGDNLEHTAGI